MSAYTALSLAVDVSAHHSTASASLQNTCDTLPCRSATALRHTWHHGRTRTQSQLVSEAGERTQVVAVDQHGFGTRFSETRVDGDQVATLGAASDASGDGGLEHGFRTRFSDAGNGKMPRHAEETSLVGGDGTEAPGSTVGLALFSFPRPRQLELNNGKRRRADPNLSGFGFCSGHNSGVTMA